MAGLLLSYYGDDFTGSTDVMEALASHGVGTVLFTRRPAESEYRQFTDYLAMGLAGTSRSETPAWMEARLRPELQWLASLGARLCHYKVCSTFDSSPATGNIGKAIDIGRDVFRQDIVPLIVGAPQLKRYTAFGHLFAAYQGEVYRIDRHPVMSRHPVTPMAEADLRLHLARQTATPAGLVGLDVLGRDSVDAEADAIAAQTNGIVLLDVVDAASQLAAGRQVLRMAKHYGPFVAGSSGIEYAVMRALLETGEIPGHAEFAPLSRMDRIAAVSGSCSPTTERQIRYALANGFDGVEIDPLTLAGSDAEPVVKRAVERGLSSLAAGRSVLVYTALGGGSDRGAELSAVEGGRHRIGRALGRVARALIERAGLRRVVIAGGDTSSHALGELDIFALTTR